MNDIIEQSIPERFEGIVKAYADRLALKMGERSLSYGELNRYANRIARAILENRGLGSEPIALLFDHGIDLIAAIFGVLKAGKFFVVLDPTCPIERTKLIVADSQAKLIITNDRGRFGSRLVSNIVDATLNVDELVCGVSDENLGVAISPATISSIMYTSGSTGTPKGVIDTHANILESSRLLAQRVHLISDDRLTLLHMLTYGSGRTNLYLSLLNGASLFPFDVHHESLEHLAQWLTNERITILHCPVALFRQFAKLYADHVPASSLRLVHLSGASISRHDFELYQKCFNDSVLLEISMGSTEARSIAGAVLNKQFAFPSEGSPVGYAPPGKTILIVDSEQQTLPEGQIGEIAVKGRNLNPGYWRMSDLTNERYLPGSDGTDEKIYLTGDLGLLLADGFLIHLGRKDLMVKIRGYRVDLGEVERTLQEHPLVCAAGVTAWDRGSEPKYLAAYVVPRQPALNVSDLNVYLRTKLPEYMVPTSFVFLDALPLTNGKLDRSALLRPDQRRPNLGTAYVAPRNEVERKLSQIWAETLVLDPVGVDDDFFDLGGNSLAATVVLGRIKEVFGVELPVSDLFTSPTITRLSLELQRRQADQGESPPKFETQCPSATMDRTPSVMFSRDELDRSVPARFEEIVRQFPDRLAIKDKNRAVTYAELNKIANRVAHTLLLRHSTSHEPIGLFLEKGVEQFAAMLGVLKAGKFFVLLDPAWPVVRITDILRDSDAKLVISDAVRTEILDRASERPLEFIALDTLDAAVSTANHSVPVARGSCAYLIYTSGSTGRPKGVIQTHRNLLHRVMLRTNKGEIAARDRVALLPSGTSNTISNAFQALLNGAALYPFDVKKEGVDRLATWLAQESISVCFISSALFRSLCQVLSGSDSFPELRFLRLRSESARRSDIDLFRKYFSPRCILVHSLSSSETGPLCEYLIRHDTDISGDELPVGYPEEDKQILLLDDQGEEVGYDQIGEIVVRSRYLSPGYWRRPQLNREKFKPDPAARGRLYYTGDLGLKLRDGCIIHKGRKDSRVKIRGYGVEIQEVEKAVRKHDAIADVVVLSKADGSGVVRLVAYFTCASQQFPTTSELRQFLAQTLPDFMIPAVFVRLQALPLSPNGKIDRAALPEPDDHRPELSTPYVSPRNQTERMLVHLCEEVLGVRRVGIDDDFFDLGGDSLKLATFVARIGDEVAQGIPAHEFLQAPQIRSLARLVDQKVRLNGRIAAPFEKSEYLVNLRPGTGDRKIFCFPYRGGFRGEYFNFCRISRHFSSDYSFYGLRARGVDGDEPRGTLSEIAADFRTAIMTVQPHGPYILVGECGGGIPAVETARQLRAAGEEVELLMLLDTQAWSLKSYLWRRITEPLKYRQRLGLMPASWDYFEKRLRYHLKELSLKGGAHRAGYLLAKSIKVPGALTHSIRSANTPESPPGVALPARESSAAVSHFLVSEKDYFIAAHRYRYRPYDGRIVLLVNEEWHQKDASLGWQPFATGRFDIYRLPGDHDHCVPDNIARVAELLKKCLTATDPQRESRGA